MKWIRSINENWIRDETLKSLRNRDKKRLARLKAKRNDKQYRLVKTCDMPLTFVEIEIK